MREIYTSGRGDGAVQKAFGVWSEVVEQVTRLARSQYFEVNRVSHGGMGVQRADLVCAHMSWAHGYSRISRRMFSNRHLRLLPA